MDIDSDNHVPAPRAIGEDGMPLWEGPAIGLLDLDAFFASVEQLDHPEWRGLPLIVGGSDKARGVVSTASYEARAFGVSSAMPSITAKRLCPNAIWTNGNFARYREMSNQVMGIIEDETPFVEQVSIDEAFFDISPGRFSKESPITICRRIQSRVADLGITCSIGIAPNKTCAKIASDMEKPRGLTVVLPGTEASFLAPLPVRTLSGIGAATERHLARLGIKTLGQLSRANEEALTAELGVVASRLILRASGAERSIVRRRSDPEEVKSVSNERTFAQDASNREDLHAAIMHVSSVVGRRLRAKGLSGHVVTLKLKFDVEHVHTAQAQLADNTDDERVFGRKACELFDKTWCDGMPVRLIGVAISGFDELGARQMELLPSSEEPADDTSALARATDAVRNRFGTQALSVGWDLRYQGMGSDPTGKY